MPVQNLFFQPFGNFSTSLLNATELATWRTTSGKTWPSITELKGLKKNVMIAINGGTFPQTPLYNVDLNSNLVPPNNDAKNFDSSNCNNLEPDFTFFQESDFYIKLDFLGLNVSYNGGETVGHLQGSGIQEYIFFLFFFFQKKKKLKLFYLFFYLVLLTVNSVHVLNSSQKQTCSTMFGLGKMDLLMSVALITCVQLQMLMVGKLKHVKVLTDMLAKIIMITIGNFL